MKDNDLLYFSSRQLCKYCVSGNHNESETCDCEDVPHLEDLINTKEYEAISVAINEIAVFNYIEAAILFFIVVFTLISLPLCPANR